MRGSQRWDETWHRLSEWTNGQGPSERLAQQVLLSDGFTDLDPSHPLGGKDGGKDAITFRDGKRWVMAVYFPRGQQPFRAIKDKFVQDLAGVAKNAADAFAFVTNQELRLEERKELKGQATCPVKLYHLDRMVAILDQPKMHQVRSQFLGIEISGNDLTREQRLDELWRASIARCAARWQGVGLPRSLAAALAEDITRGAADVDLLPNRASPVVVWTAPMGSGKSISADRYHQASLSSWASQPEGPIPVFLRGADCVPRLASAVEAASAELGSVRISGANVVVDGLDEIGYQAAGEILEQARILSGTLPSTTVLLTSRPTPLLAEAVERRSLPPLSEAEQEACISLAAEEPLSQHHLYSLPDTVRATATQPLFALLIGLWFRHHSDSPRAPIDLLALLGEQATSSLQIDQRRLRDLAVASIMRELGPVHPAEVLRGRSEDELLATGLIERTEQGLAFVLPAVAQWFGAQAVLLDELQIDSILEAREDVDLWRYPLALAVGLGSADQASKILARLLEVEAGFGLRVIRTTFGQAVVGRFPPPPWREAGKRLREAMQALADAAGPLASRVCHTNSDGRLLPMAISSYADALSVAFPTNPSGLPEMFQLDEPINIWEQQEWASVRSGRVGPGAAWAWQWATTDMERRLQALLEARALPVPADNPLAAEISWATACELAKSNILFVERLDLGLLSETLRTLLGEWYDHAGPLPWTSNGRTYDLRFLRLAIDQGEATGQSELVAPLPPADVNTGGGWIGNFYSTDRLADIAKKQYELVIVAYRQLVERWFPRLLPRLEHYALMPMRVVGYVETVTAPQYGPVPHLSGYTEALSRSSNDEVDIHVGKYDWSIGESLYARQRARRPQAARWLTGTHGGLSFEISSRYPVAEAVYSWIVRDLKGVGLNITPSHIRRSNAWSPLSNS